MSESRVRNTKRNLISSMIRQLLGILLPFIARTIVLYKLGAQYQGLDSLFKSILYVLNLADLGFSSAVIYVLYRPIAKRENEVICAIMAYLKRVYRIVGMVILGVGLLSMPLLPQLISNDYPPDLNIYVLYMLYLANNVISYCGFAYKNALMTAMQREDVVNNVYTITSTGLRVLQILLLIAIPNYYVYVLLIPVFTILNNMLIAYYSKKICPEIEPRGTISPELRKELTKQIKGIVVCKVGDVARNGCDSIFVSAFLGLVAVAVYDNYLYIFMAIHGITLAVTNAIQASVGNSIATETTEKNYADLGKFSFLFSWISGWFAICMCCLYQPFMKLWMNGNTDMLLSTFNMGLFVVYYYAISMNNIRNLYVNGVGLFWELRLWYVFEALGNIVLNLVLGYCFGVTGIIVATIITVFVCNFITRTNVLFKSYFKRPPTEFYQKHLIWFAAVAVNCVITYSLCVFIRVDGLAGLVLRGIICVIVPNIVFFIFYCKTNMFKESLAFVRRVIVKR